MRLLLQGLVLGDSGEGRRPISDGEDGMSTLEGSLERLQVIKIPFDNLNPPADPFFCL